MRGRRGRLPSVTSASVVLPGPSREPRSFHVCRLEPLVRAHLETIPNYCDLDYSKVNSAGAFTRLIFFSDL